MALKLNRTPVGALLIIKPGTDAMQPALLFPLAAATIFAVQMILTRKVSLFDGVLTTLLWTSAFGAVVVTCLVIPVWTWPDAMGWSLMLVIGVLSATTQYAIFKAFEAAPASVVAPFDYTRLIWATAFGFVIFGDFPDILTIAGGVIVAAGGLYILLRESRLRS